MPTDYEEGELSSSRGDGRGGQVEKRKVFFFVVLVSHRNPSFLEPVYLRGKGSQVSSCF